MRRRFAFNYGFGRRFDSAHLHKDEDRLGAVFALWGGSMTPARHAGVSNFAEVYRESSSDTERGSRALSGLRRPAAIRLVTRDFNSPRLHKSNASARVCGLLLLVKYLCYANRICINTHKSSLPAYGILQPHFCDTILLFEPVDRNTSKTPHQGAQQQQQ